jgi:hypothetical protein
MHRSETLKTLKDIEDAIQHEQNAGELLVILFRLLEVAETTAVASPIEVGRMNELAECLAEIRSLLVKFGSKPALQGVSGLAKDMASRFRDLEGRIKEIRNDCMARGR